MWRYLVGGVATLALVGAGWLIFDGVARPDPLSAPMGAARQTAAGVQDDPQATSLPEAPARDREQKRFDRYDKDRDGKVTRDEYLVPRRKAFAKLDVNGDGRLSFDEWAIKTTTHFSDADHDRSGAMDAKEFATTAPKRKTQRPTCRSDDAVKSDE